MMLKKKLTAVTLVVISLVTISILYAFDNLRDEDELINSQSTPTQNNEEAVAFQSFVDQNQGYINDGSASDVEADESVPGGADTSVEAETNSSTESEPGNTFEENPYSWPDYLRDNNEAGDVGDDFYDEQEDLSFDAPPGDDTYEDTFGDFEFDDVELGDVEFGDVEFEDLSLDAPPGDDSSEENPYPWPDYLRDNSETGDVGDDFYDEQEDLSFDAPPGDDTYEDTFGDFEFDDVEFDDAGY